MGCPGYIAVILIWAQVISLQPSDARKTAKPAGWILQQTSEVMGKQTTYLCPDRMKVDSSELTIVVQPPGWKTTVYNNVSRVCFVTTLDELKKNLVSSSRTTPSVRKGRTGTIAGLHVTEYFVDKVFNRKICTQIEFWATTDLPISDQLAEYFRLSLEVPKGYGLPLRVTHAHGLTKSRRLDTLSCQPAHISQSQLTGPAGYKQVHDQVALMMGEAPQPGRR